MNSTCWISSLWIANSWVDGSWCPISPVPPAPPAPVVEREPLLWGPSIQIYKEPMDNSDKRYQRQRREEEEIIIL